MIQYLIRPVCSLIMIWGIALCLPVTTQAAELQGELERASLVWRVTDTYTWASGAVDFTLAPNLVWDFDDSYRFGVREAYLDWQLGKWDFSLGRRVISFGPGRYGSPILGPLGRESLELVPLAETSRAEGYDQIGYAFQWHRLKYQKFYANAAESDYRMLLGQRTTIDWGRFTLGFSETALVKDGAPAFVYLPIPFVPVYFYQYFGNHWGYPETDESINVNVDFDLTWAPTARTKVYFMYYMDDRPWPKLGGEIPEWDQFPWRVGYQLGGEWQEAFHQPNRALYLEYTRIDNYTYSSFRDGLNYTYHDQVIGDPLGPDADRLNLEWAAKVSANWSWSLALIHERHGEGEIGDTWSPLPGRTEVFLSGVVETTDLLAFTLTREFTRAKLGFTVGTKRVLNEDNLSGIDNIGWEAKLFGRIDL